MVDVEKRRAKQRAYWARRNTAIKVRRLRSAVPPDRVDLLRERDRNDYRMRRESILAAKADRRKVAGDVLREQARQSYQRHADEARANARAHHWLGSDLRDLWRAIKEVRAAVRETKPKRDNE